MAMWRGQGQPAEAWGKGQDSQFLPVFVPQAKAQAHQEWLVKGTLWYLLGSILKGLSWGPHRLVTTAAPACLSLAGQLMAL